MKNNGETEEDNRDSGVLSVPLSFLRNGSLNNLNSVFGGRGDGGYYWFPRSSTTSNSNAFAFHNTRLNLKDSSNRGVGFAVRSL